MSVREATREATREASDRQGPPKEARRVKIRKDDVLADELEQHEDET